MSLRAAVALAAVLALAPAAAPQEGPAKPAAPAPDDGAKRKEKKVRRYLELARFREATLAGLDAAFDQQVRLGMLPKAFPARFREVADFDALEAIAVESWGAVLNEPTLDAVIAFYESEGGGKFAAANLEIVRGLMKKLEPWAMETAMKTMQSLGEKPPEEEDGDEDPGETVVGSLQAAKITSNETAAIATLRNLGSCQAQIQTSGKIDCDKDGIGEHGTFLEMTGSAEVRTGFDDSPVGGSWAPARGDFTDQGSRVSPPIVSVALSRVDASGVVRKSGYCFRIFLPDSDPKAARFTHEVGPADKIGLSGGTARVGVDMSETTWCVYAWPEKIGDTGNRAFFANQSGDVMQSANATARWELDKAPPGDSAFLGENITAPVAVGTRGRDGEVWQVCN